MSHALGEIWSAGGKLWGYFEYDGTSDVVCTRVHLTALDVQEYWRKDNQRACKCGGAGESAILYTNYGFGSHWPGRVCWNCMAITEGISDLEATDGHPFLNEWMIARYGRLLECPTCRETKLKADGAHAPILCGGCGAHWYEWNIVPKSIADSGQNATESAS